MTGLFNQKKKKMLSLRFFNLIKNCVIAVIIVIIVFTSECKPFHVLTICYLPVIHQLIN